MPLNPCCDRNVFAPLMNLARVSELETILEKKADGKFHPPMEAITFNPGRNDVMVLIDAGSFCSTVINWYSVESLQLPKGEDAQYGIGDVPAGGQK
jgi:hypothetical protein